MPSLAGKCANGRWIGSATGALIDAAPSLSPSFPVFSPYVRRSAASQGVLVHPAVLVHDPDPGLP